MIWIYWFTYTKSLLLWICSFEFASYISWAILKFRFLRSVFSIAVAINTRESIPCSIFAPSCTDGVGMLVTYQSSTEQSIICVTQEQIRTSLYVCVEIIIVAEASICNNQIIFKYDVKSGTTWFWLTTLYYCFDEI